MVELDGAGVVGAKHQHAFSWGWTGGVGDAGVEREGADIIVCAPSKSSNGPGAVRAVAASNESMGGFGRYGAPMYPFDPEERGTVAPIRRYDGPGTLGEVTEENKGEWHDSSSSNSCSSSCSSGWMGLGVENQLSRLIRGKRGGQKHVSSTCFVCCASCVFLG